MKIVASRRPAAGERDRLVAECVENYNAYLNRSAEPRTTADAVLEWEGEGCFVRDVAGREFLDCLGGYGIFALGHRHPRVVAAVTEQLGRLALHSQHLLNPVAADAARRLAEVTPGRLRKTFWCSSGTEAVEGALKLARLYTGRPRFVSTVGSFHGKTMGSLSVTGRDIFRRPFEPLLDAAFVPYGDAGAIAGAVDGDTAAVILEPVQGEGGVNVPPDDYLPAVREVCTERGALLIFDEVQTGLGRTGAMFGCDHWGVVPDVMALGKAISGGVVPCAAFTSTDEIWTAFHPNPFYHTSTFGANPLATAAAAATIETIRDEGLVERSARMGERFLAGLRGLAERFPALVREVRGRGLLIGVEAVDAERGRSIARRLFERDVLVAHTLNKPEVIRVEPPLVITEQLVDRALGAFEESLAETSEPAA